MGSMRCTGPSQRSIRQPFFWNPSTSLQTMSNRRRWGSRLPILCSTSKEDIYSNDRGSHQRGILTSCSDSVRNDVKLTDTQSSFFNRLDVSPSTMQHTFRFNLLKLFHLKFLYTIKSHDNGMQDDLTRLSPRNIILYLQLFQKKHVSRDNFLKTPCYRSSPYQFIHRILFLHPNSLKHDLIYSRSIMMVSYGQKKRSYSSWFSRITKTYLLTLKASKELLDPTISPTTSSP